MGRPGDAVVAGPALLLNLDDPYACAVTAEAAVLPGAAVTRGGVPSPCRVVMAAFLLGSTHLQRQTVKVMAEFMLMTDYMLMKVNFPSLQNSYLGRLFTCRHSKERNSQVPNKTINEAFYCFALFSY